MFTQFTQWKLAKGVASFVSSFKKALALIAVFNLTFQPLIQTSLYMAYAEDLIVPATTDTYQYLAPNGVPVVNIATPNGSGLSYNKYNKFNVETNGAVLNNTSEVLQSQLAGSIRGNPNITKGNEASIILNEVVSPNRSSIKGFVEVNGKAADVIVANPYGITINGGGFINTTRGVFTTGTPSVSGSTLQGFSVTKGDILIEGKGLNGTNPNFLDLVARSLKIDGQVNAKDLHITAGANQWNYQDKNATPIAGSGTAPSYAIDSTLLGGMYANRIRLIATENGVGVRSNGELAATAEEFFLKSAGTVQINNNVSSAKDMTIQSTGGGVEISGATTFLSSGGTMDINGAASVSLSDANLYANNNLTIQGASLTDTVTSSNAGVRSAKGNISVSTTGGANVSGSTYYGGDNLSINSASFTATDSNLYGGTQSGSTGQTVSIAAAGNIDLTGTNVEAGKHVSITSSAGQVNLNASGKAVQAGDTVSLTGKTGISNNMDVRAGNSLTVRSADEGTALSVNNSGYMEAATISVQDAQGGGNLNLTNSGSLVAENLSVKASSINNQGGASVLQGTNSTSISASDSITNEGKIIGSQGSGSTTTVLGKTLANSGDLYTKGTLDLTLTGNSLFNSGNILADGDLLLTGNSGLDITNSGYLQAGGALDLANGAVSIQSLTNQDGGVISGTTVNVKTTGNLTNATGSFIQANSVSTFDVAGTFSNTGTIIASGTGKTANWTVGTLGGGGSIGGAGSLNLLFGNTSLTLGSSDTFALGQTLSLKNKNNATFSLTNNGGRIQAGLSGTGTLDLTNGGVGLTSFTNQSGGVIYGGTVNVNTTGDFTNNGTIRASGTGQTANWTVGTMGGIGSIGGEGSLNLLFGNTSLTLGSSDKFALGQNLTLRNKDSNAFSLTNNGGRIQAGGTLDLTNGGVGLTSFTNQSGGVIYGGTVNVNTTGDFTNSGSSSYIQANSVSAFDVAGTFSNSGIILAAGSGQTANWTVGRIANNGIGTIGGEGSLNLLYGNNSITVGSSEKIVMGEYLTLRPTHTDSVTFTNNGILHAGEKLTLTGKDGADNFTITNNNLLSGANGIDLKGTGLTNNSGATIQAPGGISTWIFTDDSITNNGTMILSGTIDVGQFLNTSEAVLQSDGSIKFDFGGNFNGLVFDNKGNVNIAGPLTFNKKWAQQAGVGIVSNDGGKMLMGSLSITTGTTDKLNLDNTHGGLIKASGNMDLQVNSLYNIYGSRIQGNNITINTQYSLQNGIIGSDSSSVLLALNNLNITTPQLENGAAIHARGNNSITVTGTTASSLKNGAAAGLSANNYLNIYVFGDFTNLGSLYAGSSLTVNGGTVSTPTAVTITNANSGQIYSPGSVGISSRINSAGPTTGSVINNGQITGKDVYLSGDLFTNTGSVYGNNILNAHFTSIANGSFATLSGNSVQLWGVSSQGPISNSGSILANTLDVKDFTQVVNKTGDYQPGSGSSIEKSEDDTSLDPQNQNNPDAVGGTGTSSVGGTSGSSVSGTGTRTSPGLLYFLGINISLPSNPNGPFVVNKDPNAQYLVEMNPLYGDSGDYLGSDYLFEQLGINEQQISTTRRLGDAAYENYLIQQQVAAYTGRTVLDMYGGDADLQTLALMYAGAETAKELDLKIGIALTKEQVDKLTTDIVWMVETVVNGVKVLAPKVYFANATQKKPDQQNGVISANNATISAGAIENRNGGLIQARDNLVLEATTGDIINESSTIRGGNVSLSALNGSVINTRKVNQVVKESPVKDVLGVTLDPKVTYMETFVGEAGLIEATNNLSIQAGLDIKNLGSNIKAGGNANLLAKRDIIFDTIEKKTVTTDSSSSSSKSGTSGTFSSSKKSKEGFTTTTTTEIEQVQGSIVVGGNLNAKADRDIVMGGTTMKAGGDLTLEAGRDQRMEQRENSTSTVTDSIEKTTKVKKSLFDTKISTKTTTTHSEDMKTTAVTNDIISGGNMTRIAGNELLDVGTTIQAGGDYTQRADKITNLAAMDRNESFTNTTTQKNSTSMKLFSSPTNFAENKNIKSTETVKTTEIDNKAKVSTVNVGGNFTSESKNETLLEGTKISAGGNVDLKGGSIDITSARDVKMKETIRDVEKTENTNKIGLMFSGEAKSGASAGASAAGVTTGAEAKAEASASGRLNFANSNTKLTNIHEENLSLKDTTQTATITAGGSMNMNTTGGDINLEGTAISAKKDVNFNTNGGNLNFKAAEDRDINRSQRTEKTTEINTALGVGGSGSASASAEAKAGVGYTGDATSAKAGVSAQVSASVKTDITVNKTSEKTEEIKTTAKVGSIQAGNDVNLDAQKGIHLEGTNISGGGSFNAKTDNFTYAAAEDTYQKTHSKSSDTHAGSAEVGLTAKASAEQSTSEGSSSSGIAGVQAGVAYDYTHSESKEKERSTTAKAGNLSFGKDVNINSKNNLVLEGTNVEAGGGVSLKSEEGSVEILAARDTYEKSSNSKSYNVGGAVNGIIGLGGGDGGAGFEVNGNIHGSYSKSTENEMKSDAKAGSIKSGAGGVTIEGQKNVVLEGTNVDTKGNLNLNAKEGNVEVLAAESTYSKSSDSYKVQGQIDISLSKAASSSGGGTENSMGLNASGSMSKERIESTTQQGATLKAGGNVTVSAGKDATFVGTDVSAGKDISVNAGGDVNILAAEDTYKASKESVEIGVSGKVTNKSGGSKSDNNENDASQNANTQNATQQNATDNSNNAKGTGSNGSKNENKKELSGNLTFDVSGKESTKQKAATFTSGGTTDISAGDDINLEGTKINSGGTVTLNAGDDVNMKAIQSKEKSYGVNAGVSASKDDGITGSDFGANAGYKEKNEGVEITSGGALTVNADGKIRKEGADLKSNGEMALNAEEGIESKDLKKDKSLGFNLDMPSASVEGSANGSASYDEKNGFKANAGTSMDASAEGGIGAEVMVGNYGMAGGMEGKASTEQGISVDNKEGVNTTGQSSATGSVTGDIHDNNLLNKGVNAVTEGATKAANTVADETKKTAETVADETKKAANVVSDKTKEAGVATIDYAAEQVEKKITE